MADNFVDLKFLADTTQLDKAITKTNRIEREIKKLVNAERVGKITKDQYTQSVGSLASELQKTSNNNIRARKAVYDYSQEMWRAANAVESNTQDVIGNTAAVSQQGSAYRRTGAAVNQYGRQIPGVGKKTNKIGMQFQQAGYQIGDFAVQIQGGTNAAVAFGQQGSQLLGIFGPAGALAGAAVAIGAAFVAPLIRASEEAQNLMDKLDEAVEKGYFGGDEVSQEIAAITSAIIESENRIARLREGIASRTEGREGTSYEEELNRLMETTNAQIEAETRIKQESMVKLSLLREQAELQKRLVGDQAQEAENLQYNRDLARQKAAEEEESARVLAEQRAKVNDAAREDLRLRNQEIYLLSIQKKYGEDSIQAKNLLMRQTAENLRLSYEQSGVDSAIIDKLVTASVAASSLSSELGAAASNAWNIYDGLSAASAEMLAQSQVDKGVLPPQAMADFKAPPTQAEKNLRAFHDRRIAAERAERVRASRSSGSSGGGAKKAPSGGSGGSSSLEKQLDAFEVLKKQVAETEKYLHVTKGVEEATKAAAAANEEAGKAGIKWSEQEIEALAAKIDALDKYQQIMSTVESSFEDSLMSMVDGTKTVGEAFKDMASEIIKELYRVLVVQRMVQSVTGAIGGAVSPGSISSGNSGGFLGTLLGSVTKGLSGGRLASGGTVMPGKGYLVGERGPEVIVPRHSGTVQNANMTASNLSSGGTTEVVVTLSPELIGEVLKTSANQTVQIVGAASKMQSKSLKGQITNVQSRGVS